MIIKKLNSGNFIEWKAESPDPINEYIAKCLQVKGEYHPAGYGFYNFSCEQVGDKYIATWKSGASCD